MAIEFDVWKFRKGLCEWPFRALARNSNTRNDIFSLLFTFFSDTQLLSNVELPESFFGDEADLATLALAVEDVPGGRLGIWECVI